MLFGSISRTVFASFERNMFNRIWVLRDFFRFPFYIPQTAGLKQKVNLIKETEAFPTLQYSHIFFSFSIDHNINLWHVLRAAPPSLDNPQQKKYITHEQL